MLTSRDLLQGKLCYILRHSIRDEWVLGMKSNCGNFLNFTNNRLESINGKLINRHSSLEEFVDRFFVILTAERDHKAAS